AQLRAPAHRGPAGRCPDPPGGGGRLPRRGGPRSGAGGRKARGEAGDRMTDALLEVRGLRVGYGELPVLQGIDFDVEAGSRTVLLGLNGAGKTTTVSAIAGLLKPWKGTITFDGQRIDGRDPAVLVERGIALVPEGRRTFPALTVAQNLRLGTWTKRARKSELAEAAERVYDYFPVLAERRDQ